jgi:hypothetical protein
LETDEIKRSHRSVLRADPGPGWVLLLMVKKEAAAGLPWGGKGHYMGLNFGVF